MSRVEAPSVVIHRPMDDEALAAMAAQDRQAFLLLYDHYVGPVERYIAARTNSSDVEDLVSITFTRALSHINRYRPERGRFAAWLFTIARNAVIDHHRRRSRSVPLEPSAPFPSGTPGPEAMALADEERR